MTQALNARLEAGDGLAVRVELQPSGRARACSEGTRLGDIARCEHTPTKVSNGA